MDILVGLWSRDTTAALAGDAGHLGTRLFQLEEALTATQARLTEQAGRYAFDGAIRGIFVAPEYLFATEGQSGSTARALEDPDRVVLKDMLREISSRFPHMLIVPGTVIYRQTQSNLPGYAAKLARASDKVLKASREAAAYPVDPGSALSAAQKNDLLRRGDASSKLIKNRMYVLLDGNIAFSYGKHGDFAEATGTDASNGVFVPGLKGGLKEIGGLRFGFEVCFDHARGVLKLLSEGPGGFAPDIQIICSAYVENNLANMVVRAGGFALHASSDRRFTGVFPRTQPARTVSGSPVPLGYMRQANDPTMAEVLIGPHVVDAGGSPLSTYVIRLRPAGPVPEGPARKTTARPALPTLRPKQV